MITLTEVAISKVKEIAEAEDIKTLALRVLVRGGGCAGFQYDLYFEEEPPKTFDEEFEHDGIKIICDPLSHQYLDGAEIDFVEEDFSSGFKFKNPNISGSCGCGSSVSF